jgi:hypothetical protein
MLPPTTARRQWRERDSWRQQYVALTGSGACSSCSPRATTPARSFTATPPSSTIERRLGDSLSPTCPNVLDHLADPGGVVADETGFMKKASSPPGYNAGIRAPPAGSRTTSSASTGICTCPRRGPTTATAIPRRGSVTANEAYCDNPGLRDWARRAEPQLRHGGVLRRPVHHRHRPASGRWGAGHLRTKRGWPRLSAGQGSKRHLLYDWLFVDPAPLSTCSWYAAPSASPANWRPTTSAAATRRQPSPKMVRVAGSRWGVEEIFQFAKNETGLDHYQVRRYDAWYRHITLSRFAAAFLAITDYTEQLRDKHHEVRLPY